MRILTQAKLKLAKSLQLNLSSISTDRGDLYFDGDLEEGTEVFIVDSEGNYVVPEDGDYKEGNRTFTVENGVVTKIISEEEVIVETELEEVIVETVSKEEFNELVSTVQMLISAIEELKGSVDEVKEEVVTVDTELKSALKMSKKEFVKNKPEVKKDQDVAVDDKTARFFGKV